MAPTKDANSRTRFTTSRKEGLHQLGRYCASVMPAVAELAEYLGHADPGFTGAITASGVSGPSNVTARTLTRTAAIRMSIDAEN